MRTKKLFKSIVLAAAFMAAILPVQIRAGQDPLLGFQPAQGAEIKKTGLDYAAILSLVNTERRKNGSGALAKNKELDQLARLRLSDMQALHYFAHTNPNGQGLRSFIGQVAYDYSYAGENLAINYLNSSDVVQAWMDSPKHRTAILRQNYQDIGLAWGEVDLYGSKNTVIVMELGRE